MAFQFQLPWSMNRNPAQGVIPPGPSGSVTPVGAQPVDPMTPNSPVVNQPPQVDFSSYPALGIPSGGLRPPVRSAVLEPMPGAARGFGR